MATETVCTADARHVLSDAIHTLAQPLTAMSFVVDMALMQDSPEAWKTALEHVRTETRRAVAALEQARGAAQELYDDEVTQWRQR